MKTARVFVCGVLFCLGAARAQEVVLDGGETIAGTVAQVKDNRVQVRGVDGAMRQLSVRQVECERRADGTLRRFHADLRDGDMDPAESALLASVQKAQEVPFPELMRATERCSRAFVEALRRELTQGSAGRRTQAARVLAVTSVPEAVKAALEVAVEDHTGRMLAVVVAMWNGASVGALEAAEALALLDQGLATKDADARFQVAWLGAQLGSDAALPVLARFLGDSDHHVRESAAVALAERGDAAGVAIVLAMAKRDRAPVQIANRGADAETRAMCDRIAGRERCHACELLGKLHHEPALPVLRRLATAKDEALAAAAKAAVAAITADH